MTKVVSFSALAAELKRDLTRRFQEQLPFAVAVALTRTANAVRADLRDDMTKIFDRPVPYTLNALRTIPATKQNMTAVIAVKNKSAPGSHAPVKFLGPEIVSGPRNKTGIENVFSRAGLLQSGWFMVPGRDAKLDIYGNLSSAQANTVLAAVKAGLSGSTYVPVKAKRGSRLDRLNKNTGIFVVQPGARGLNPGVYQRAGKGVLSLYNYVQGAPQYRERFPFDKLASAHAKEHFETELFKSLTESVS